MKVMKFVKTGLKLLLDIVLEVLSLNMSPFTLKSWNLETGDCVKTLNGHTSWVMSCCISNDDQFMNENILLGVIAL